MARKTIALRCEQCGKEIEVYESEYNRSLTKHFFCSHSCSAKYNNKNRVVHRNSESNHYNRSSKKRICKVCGKEYYHNWGNKTNRYTTKLCCSKECSDTLRLNKKKYLSDEQRERYSIAGKKGAIKSHEVQRNERRSKNEKLFCSLCEGHFKNVRHNEPLFNGWDADVIIEDNKYAILWNGRWHYDELSKTTTLKQIQNRDDIKCKEITKCGYTPYVIKDMGKYNPSFVKEQFDLFLRYLECNK